MISKIQGLVYNEAQEIQLKLVQLRDKLPMRIEQLNWLMINLCSILLELAKRQDIIFPPIGLDNIYISSYDQISLPFIKSYIDLLIPKDQRLEYARTQMINILSQLNYDPNLIESQTITLQKIQEKLLYMIGYKTEDGIKFTKDFQEYLKISKLNNLHFQDNVCLVDNIKTPSFICNVEENEIIMKTYTQYQDYELREVELIEKFNNPHQPYLYSYIRYSNLLLLFLKKHHMSLSTLIADCISPREKQGKDYTEEQKCKGYHKIFHSMIKSLEILHKSQIIHRDLKPDNIMFDFKNQIKNLDDLLREEITCVIIDFDRSKNIDKNNQNNQNNITCYECNQIFSPPEGTQKQYDSSYDIWQMGFIWLLYLKDAVVKKTRQPINKNEEIQPIFQYQNEYQILKKLEDKVNQYIRFIQIVNQQKNYIKINGDLLKMILKMIEFNPKDRPDLNTILKLIEGLINNKV